MLKLYRIVGAILLVAAIWDAITDPGRGWIDDRVKTCWGRYRLWLLLRTFQTTVYTPHTAMIAQLSTNGPVRCGIAGVETVYTAAAAMTVSCSVLDAIEFFDGGAPADRGEEARCS